MQGSVRSQRICLAFVLRFARITLPSTSQYNTVPTTYLRRYFERLGLRYKFFLSMRQGAAVLTEGQLKSLEPR